MTVLVTGASSGIGEACARAFAAAKHDLVLVARRKEKLEELKSQLQAEFKIKIHCASLDIRNRAQVERLAQESFVKAVDVLINNAGLAKGLDVFQEANLDDFEVMIDTNIKGLLYMTRVLLPSMLANEKGHIVNIGSVAGHWVYDKGNVYCATKFAVRALTEALRLDLDGTGIRVTEIAPGMVETEFSAVRFGDKKRGDAVYAGKNCLKSQDIAEAILWCTQRPAHVNIQELVIFPTDQASVRGGKRFTPR